MPHPQPSATYYHTKQEAITEKMFSRLAVEKRIDRLERFVYAAIAIAVTTIVIDIVSILIEIYVR